MVTFTHEGFVSVHENNKNLKTSSANTSSENPSNTNATYQGTATTEHEGASMVPSTKQSNRRKVLSQVDLHAMAQNNPFYKEAAKIMQGKLNETDANRRHTILNYCEHFRTAYTTKDIDLFLLWDFRNKSMPLIHVRTWQPASTVGGNGDIINIQDFNLQ